MEKVEIISRVIHDEGETSVCYTDDKRIITCGADSEVRLWKNAEEDEPISYSLKNACHIIASYGDQFYVAETENSVSAYDVNSGEYLATILRFTGSITCLHVQKQGGHIAAGAGDFDIKIYNAQTKTQHTLQGHEAPILSLSQQRGKGNLLASSSCDGTVRIWKPPSSTPLKILKILEKSNDVSTARPMHQVDWSISGQDLFVPIGHEVIVYNRLKEWSEHFRLDSAEKEVLSLLQVSACGEFIVSSSMSGSIYIWNIKSQALSLRKKVEQGLCSLAWNPNDISEICSSDRGGNLNLVQNLPLNAQKDKSEEMTAEEVADMFDGDGDNDDADIFGDGIDKFNDASDDNKVDELKACDPLKDQFPQDSDDNEDDLEIKSLKKKARIHGFFDDEEDNASRQSHESASRQIPAAPAVVPDCQSLQPPFQSGSSVGPQRFMVWNSVGIVKLYESEEESSIEVSFHDSKTHHAIHVDNYLLDHTMAALTDKVFVLACKSDVDRASKLVVNHFAAWNGVKEWRIDMPEKENIVAVAAGDGFVAVATDKRFVRLFSLSGMQLQILSISGPIVTLAAHIFQLLIVYHAGAALPGDQNLGFSLFEESRMTVSGLPLPLTPKSTLLWIGFSAEGTPFHVDSSHNLYCYNFAIKNTWMPVAQLKKQCKGRSELPFVIGVSENPQQIRCVLCKGSLYPPIFPLPTVTVLPFTLPLCDSLSEKSQLEQNIWKSRLFSQYCKFGKNLGFDDDDDEYAEEAIGEQSENLIKLFAIACRDDDLSLAEEIAEQLHKARHVQLAIKYCSRLNLLSLAERLAEVARRKDEREMRQDCQPDYEPPISRLSRRRMEVEENGENEDEDEIMAVTADLEADDNSSGSVEVRPAAVKGLLAARSMAPISVLTPTSHKFNPFKSAGEHSASLLHRTGSAVFDNIKKKPEKVERPHSIFSLPKKGTKKARKRKEQTDQENNQPMSDFDVWIAENQSSIEAEHPDWPASLVMAEAARRFDLLSSDAKKDKISTQEQQEKRPKIAEARDGECGTNSQEELSESLVSVRPLEKQKSNHKNKLTAFSFTKS